MTKKSILKRKIRRAQKYYWKCVKESATYTKKILLADLRLKTVWREYHKLYPPILPKFTLKYDK